VEERRGGSSTYLQPLSFLLGEHRVFHHLSLDRHTGEALEP
jgi:hypothetical protein